MHVMLLPIEYDAAHKAIEKSVNIRVSLKQGQ